MRQYSSLLTFRVDDDDSDDDNYVNIKEGIIQFCLLIRYLDKLEYLNISQCQERLFSSTLSL